MRDNPFKHPSSLRYQVFKQALKTVTIASIRKFVEVRGGDPTRMIRLLREGSGCVKKTWEYQEENDKIRVYFTSDSDRASSSGAASASKKGSKITKGKSTR